MFIFTTPTLMHPFLDGRYLRPVNIWSIILKSEK